MERPFDLQVVKALVLRALEVTWCVNTEEPDCMGAYSVAEGGGPL